MLHSFCEPENRCLRLLKLSEVPKASGTVSVPKPPGGQPSCRDGIRIVFNARINEDDAAPFAQRTAFANPFDWLLAFTAVPPNNDVRHAAGYA